MNGQAGLLLRKCGGGYGWEGWMPSIEIEMTDRVRRHLAAVRLMSFMVHPDNTHSARPQRSPIGRF